jgi:hypothetical protein
VSPHLVDAQPAEPNLHQRARDQAHHVEQEAVALCTDLHNSATTISCSGLSW